MPTVDPWCGSLDERRQSDGGRTLEAASLKYSTAVLLSCSTCRPFRYM